MIGELPAIYARKFTIRARAERGKKIGARKKYAGESIRNAKSEWNAISGFWREKGGGGEGEGSSILSKYEHILHHFENPILWFSASPPSPLFSCLFLFFLIILLKKKQ